MSNNPQGDVQSDLDNGGVISPLESQINALGGLRHSAQLDLDNRINLELPQTQFLVFIQDAFCIVPYCESDIHDYFVESLPEVLAHLKINIDAELLAVTHALGLLSMGDYPENRQRVLGALQALKYRIETDLADRFGTPDESEESEGLYVLFGATLIQSLIQAFQNYYPIEE